MPDHSPIGTMATKLVVIRGNSASGKTTIARQLQQRHGRGCALIEQDYLRRIVLRERDQPGGIAPSLIEQTVRFALNNRYHVVLEGILFSERYRPMLTALWQAHRGATHTFYLDVSFEETLRRHAMRPQATEFTPEDMRGWYHARDLLGIEDEHIVPETWSIEAAIAHIAATAGLPQQELPTGKPDAVPSGSTSRRHL